MNSVGTREFSEIVGRISGIGLQLHGSRVLEHASENSRHIQNTTRDLPDDSGSKACSAIVVSAGPSVHRKDSIKRILALEFKGAVISVDGSYVACLRNGLIPDYLLTLDPHPKRVVRWFGDHKFEEHAAEDDFFERQDLDIEFRRNSKKRNQENIELVNKYGHLTKAIVASSAPGNVVERIREAKMPMFWWNPLLDDPGPPESLTRRLYGLNRLPCMNTGGNVGSAAWVFANSILKTPLIGLVGMDFGYYADTPVNQTQTYYELIKQNEGLDNLEKFFLNFEFPLTKEKFYTDPTYFWYRRNFLELLGKAVSKTVNLTEGGTLFAAHLECERLECFVQRIP